MRTRSDQEVGVEDTLEVVRDAFETDDDDEGDGGDDDNDNKVFERRMMPVCSSMLKNS